MYIDDADPERPETLLRGRPVPGPVLFLGFIMMVGAHVLIPIAVLGSQWLLVLLGLALPVEDRVRELPPQEVIAAEFVKLGKPFDPRKLPQRKVPEIVKRKPDGVVVSKDAKEKPPDEKKEEKEKPKDSTASLLDNLVDRTKDFAEDVHQEEEGDPEGIAEGTAKEAKLGDIFAGKLSVFFHRGWEVPNVVQDPDKLQAVAAVSIADDGKVQTIEIQKSSGDPLFDQSVVDAVTALIQANAAIPEPPPEIQANYYGRTLSIRYNGKDAH